MTTGRNDPCLCGSGKKYKKCCLLKEYAPVGIEESTKQRLVQDILAFVKKDYKDLLDDAFSIFWEDFEPQDHLDIDGLQMADINFWEWVVFDWQPHNDGKTIIAHFLKAKKNLPELETSVLKIMNKAVISLYEAQEIIPEKGIVLKDLVLGGEYEVSEKTATRYVKKWDVFGTRLLKLDGRYIMTGCAYPYPVMHKERILGMIIDGYRVDKLDYPSITKRRYLKETSEDFNFYWYDIIQNPVMPKLFTTTGEPMLFCKAIYDIKDRDSAITGLKAVRGFQQEEDGGFIWVDKPDEERSTILGTIVEKDRRLVLECNCKERLTRGKEILLESIPNAVTHRLDEYGDPAQAIKSHRERPAKPDDIPFELQQEVYTQFMQKHYESWLNDSIPALGGKTPMEAIKTKAGKAKVADLLKGIENTEEGNRKAGRPHIAVLWMWERLNIDR